jgi:shikimate 5-dehydrogenase
MEVLDPIPLPLDVEDRPGDAWCEQVIGARLWCSTLPADAAQPLARTLSAITIEHPPSLLDASYHPWPTPMARAWPNSVIANGRDMLLWQAVEQVRLMTGQQPPVDMMREALTSA